MFTPANSRVYESEDTFTEKRKTSFMETITRKLLPEDYYVKLKKTYTRIQKLFTEIDRLFTC